MVYGKLTANYTERSLSAIFAKWKLTGILSKKWDTKTGQQRKTKRRRFSDRWSPNNMCTTIYIVGLK